MPDGRALGQPPPSPAPGGAQLPAGRACCALGSGQPLTPAALSRGRVGVTDHVVSGAEAWLWP